MMGCPIRIDDKKHIPHGRNEQVIRVIHDVSRAADGPDYKRPEGLNLEVGAKLVHRHNSIVSNAATAVKLLKKGKKTPP